MKGIRSRVVNSSLLTAFVESTRFLGFRGSSLRQARKPARRRDELAVSPTPVYNKFNGQA